MKLQCREQEEHRLRYLGGYGASVVTKILMLVIKIQFGQHQLSGQNIYRKLD